LNDVFDELGQNREVVIELWKAIFNALKETENGYDMLGELEDNFIKNKSDFAKRINFINEIKSAFPGSEIYGPQEKNTWEAFNLLFHASHLQIANSTFSWWAGALATFNGADVLAPKPWNLIPQDGIENLTNPKFHYRNAVFE
jgi:hypothetical protein